MSTPSILRPEVTVTLACGPVVVRDLPWQDSLEFIRRLSLHAKDLLSAANQGGGAIDVPALLPKITDLVTNAGDLSLFLLTKSTGKDAKFFAEEIGTLETMEILDAALQVNLSDGLLALGKKVGGRLARVLPAAKTTTSTTLPSATTS